MLTILRHALDAAAAAAVILLRDMMATLIIF